MTLPPNGTQRFTADRPVAWSVSDASGGSIDAGGSYTAPPAPGSYVVTATATDGSALSATAQVMVRPWQLELLAGTLGGAGSANDSRGRARFAQPKQVAFDGARTLYIADGSSVRTLDVRTGAVTTVARGPLLKTACGVALDGNGGLFVSTASGVINRVSLADASVVTVTGTAYALTSKDGPAADASFFQPCGLSWDAGRQRLYIADGNQGIRFYDAGAARVSTLVSYGGWWSGVAFAGDNDLYA
ncbi:MAG: hypothetical protein JWM53_4381, partial [bacterium]|nr:hypothetical protein [bacterium]